MFVSAVAWSICSPRTHPGYLHGLSDKGLAAVGTAGSFNYGKNVWVISCYASSL